MELESLSDNNLALQKLSEIYPGVDIELGLSYCGDDSEIYVSVLETFGQEVKIEELNSYYEKEDCENYRILVHGVKSAFLGVGFSKLSERARALEDAAKSEDWDYIHEHHQAFIEEYQRAVDAVLQTVV